MTRVLLGEDDADVTTLLGMVLENAGYAVDSVRSGAEVLARCADDPPDLLLLDVAMPGLDGIEVLRRLRSSAAPRLPVMLITARARPEDRALGLDAGADDYLVKPFDIDEVLERVDRLRAPPD